MIPAKTHAAIQHWLEHGTHPDDIGSFVRAVLSNDLRAAVFSADEENLANLSATVSWIYWQVPGGTYGSRAALLAYHELRRKGAA